MKKLLSLDMSTSSTGYAVFDMDTKKLLYSGRVTPKVSGLHKLRYPKAALLTILDMTSRIEALIHQVQPDQLVIEEINRGISRLGQKSLDALHFFVLAYLHSLSNPALLDGLKYLDSNGKKGWRGMLGLKLDDIDKQTNAGVRAQNQGKKASAKAPLIDYKVLAQRYVNVKFSKSFNVWENQGDDDEVDAIAMGDAYLLSMSGR